GRLEVDTHIITGGSTVITNVLKCVHRAGLEAAGLVFEPLASCSATLLEEEKHVGVVLLDIGGGTTDIAVYSGGGAIYTSTIPVGGNILTNDVALGLKTTTAQAEQIKRSYGCGTVENQRETVFTVTTLDGRNIKEISTAQLRAIVAPRVTETLRLAKNKIIENVPRDLILGELVITGGGAHLRGLEGAAEGVFGLPVRVGVPSTIAGLTDAVKQPQYATAVGLVIFGPQGASKNGHGRRNGYPLAKFGHWLGELWN
ncbi:MAG: cell division protein FtsA, partial [Candidatus Eremiobacteraeota bacterium]|nr:cell division protein FtsA [Candidatus Eremiobacteraeota bacterium]